MYQFALSHGLSFLETTGELDRAVGAGRLVPLDPTPGDTTYELSGGVGFSYATPEARRFIEQLAPRYVEHCGAPMVITSAARPGDRQPHNANPKSVHPTGIAVDIRRPYAGPCLDWLRSILEKMEADGRVEATEEHHPPHFHVAVLSGPGSAPRAVVARALATRAPEVILPPLHRWLAAPAELLAALLPAPTTPTLVAILGGNTPIAAPAAGMSVNAMLATAPRSAVHWTTSAGEVTDKSVRPNTYRVRTGDTLWSIARRFGVSTERLARENGLSMRAALRAKSELKIPI